MNQHRPRQNWILELNFKTKDLFFASWMEMRLHKHQCSSFHLLLLSDDSVCLILIRLHVLFCHLLSHARSRCPAPIDSTIWFCLVPSIRHTKKQLLSWLASMEKGQYKLAAAVTKDQTLKPQKEMFLFPRFKCKCQELYTFVWVQYCLNFLTGLPGFAFQAFF